MKTDTITQAEDISDLNSIRRIAPIYRMTANIKEASQEETDEILAMIEAMTEDDWETAAVHHFCLDLSD